MLADNVPKIWPFEQQMMPTSPLPSSTIRQYNEQAFC